MEPIEEKGGGGSGGGGGHRLDDDPLPPSPPTAAGNPSSPAAATAGPPAGPTKRESLRSSLAVPLIRLYSQGSSSARARAAEKERRQWEAGVAKFNQKPTAGIELLINAGLLARTPEAVAGFIRQRADELSKRKVGEYVGSPDPFAQRVLAALLREYDFEGMALDEAMRVLINDIRLPGESQVIDRILQQFASWYYQQQKQQQRAPFATEDAVYILSFSLMLLNTGACGGGRVPDPRLSALPRPNLTSPTPTLTTIPTPTPTDLHNRNLRAGDKMRLDEFIRNNRGINNGHDLPPQLLTTLYNNVKRKEIRMREGDMYESSLTPFVVPRHSGWLAKEGTGLVARWKSHWCGALFGWCGALFGWLVGWLVSGDEEQEEEEGE
jgi:hypothetical protein